MWKWLFATIIYFIGQGWRTKIMSKFSRLFSVKTSCSLFVPRPPKVYPMHSVLYRPNIGTCAYSQLTPDRDIKSEILALGLKHVPTQGWTVKSLVLGEFDSNEEWGWMSNSPALPSPCLDTSSCSLSSEVQYVHYMCHRYNNAIPQWQSQSIVLHRCFYLFSNVIVNLILVYFWDLENNIIFHLKATEASRHSK